VLAGELSSNAEPVVEVISTGDKSSVQSETIASPGESISVDVAITNLYVIARSEIKRSPRLLSNGGRNSESDESQRKR